MTHFFRAAIAICTLSAASVMAQETIVVGVENQQYLPAYSVEGGEYRGYARELLDAFAQDKGYRLEYRALPVPRLYASFFAGQIDLKFPDNPHWKAEQRNGKTISYSDSLMAFIDGMNVLPAQRGKSADALKTVGTVAGFTPWVLIDRVNAKQISITENSNFEALVRQTIAARVDGAYASVAAINYQLDQVLKQPGALVFDPGLPFSRDHYYASSIKRPELVRELSAWLKLNKARVAQLKQKHGVEKGIPAE